MSADLSNIYQMARSRLLRVRVGLKIAFGKRRRVALVLGEKALQANLFIELSKVINPTNLNGEFNLNDLSERLTQIALNISDPKPIHRDRMQVDTNGLTRTGFARFSQVCGLIGLWELNLRLLAGRLDIDVRRAQEKRGKKSAHLVDYADLSDVISALNKRTSGIKLQFNRLNRLRNTFVHGNFQAARELVIAQLNAKEKEDFRGNVIAMNLENGSTPFNLSDKMRKEELESQDQFAWFLEVFATELFDTVFDDFENSLLIVHDLVFLKSLSYGPAQDSFEKLVVLGHPLIESDTCALLGNGKSLNADEAHIRFVVSRINRLAVGGEQTK